MSHQPADAQSCSTSDALITGTNSGAWYTTLSPSEHFDSGRSQVFKNACTLNQITNSDGPYSINTRVAPGIYPALYNIATRNQNELFIYGGFAGQGGTYVARLDPDTLNELWRSSVTIPSSQWSFIGAMGVHGNGYVYSTQSNILAKIDPITGRKRQLSLPQLAAPTGTGAAYNGFVTTPDGLIVAKSMERGPCTSDTTSALSCVLSNNLPSTIVVVNPDTLTVIAQINTSEPALGRIMTERHDGIDYIYVPGISRLIRYRFSNGTLSLDTSWGPVGYGQGANASGVGILGNFAVTQTNYVPSSTPSYVVAANIYDSTQQYQIQPFPPLSRSSLSWVPDKAVLDSENNLIYAEDTYAAQIAALTINSSGLSVVWKLNSVATGFPALLGTTSARQLVIASLISTGDTLTWRNPATGAVLAQSSGLASKATIGAIAPGFKGRFYYPSFYSGQLIELTPQSP
ncbi:MAG: hypothetical protein H7Y37_05245 [Anaerolineae bacterium]|nr:hypothetical protein [Gloeobacterales cyanobacterium ES-bin-313]